MNERIRQLYQQAHDPQPPTRGTGTLTKDILWEQPDKFNPEKFALLLVKECAMLVEGFILEQEVALDDYQEYEASAVLKEHFGVEE